MGIQGLIPFLKAATSQINIKQYSGATVAVDSYCWLHKGAFSCADRLAKGEETDQYVTYCMKFIKMLISCNIKPILVFDGRNLPAKADTERVRRQRREENRRKAAELLRQDKPDEARSLIQRCIDVTPEMAFNLIRACRAIGVDCIVAPYEADAQLAYLNLTGIAHIIITEDSDLVLFGCKLVIFKMDSLGNGLLIEQSKIHTSMKLHQDRFSMERFRHMCILSGCDYLPSLPGIGLKKALKFIKKTAETDINKALTRLGAYLNMPHLVVDTDYKEKFLYADVMFKHQPVFDPRSRTIVPLTPLPEGMDLPVPNQFPNETYYQLALGNLNPFNLEKLDDWNPDKQTTVKTNSWNSSAVVKNSIWSRDFSLPKPLKPKKDIRDVERASTKGTEVVQKVDKLVEKMPFLSQKEPEEELKEFMQRYGNTPEKRPEESIVGRPLFDEEELATLGSSQKENEFEDELLNELLASKSTKKSNPFSKASIKTNSPLCRGLGKMSKINKTTIDDSVIQKSRFFDNERTLNDEVIENSVDETTENKDFDLIGMLLEEKTEIVENSPSPITPARKNVFAQPQVLTNEMNSSVDKTPKNEDFDLIGMLLEEKTEIMEKPPLSPKKNVFAEPQALTNDLYNSIQNQSEGVSFLNVLGHMNKLAQDKTPEPKSNFKWKNVKKQTFMSSFTKFNNEVKPSPPTKRPLLQAARSCGLKRKKSNVDPNQKTLSMFAFQPKVKINPQYLKGADV